MKPSGYLGDGSVEECRLVLGVVFHGLVVVVQRLHPQSLLRDDQTTTVDARWTTGTHHS